LKPWCLGAQSVDWVFSSGVLEHFDDDQILDIMTRSFQAARCGVMCLVPNAASLAYRTGKDAQERSGEWRYGREVPRYSMKDIFLKAGAAHVEEYTVDPYQALKFLGERGTLFKAFFDSLSPDELKALGQGYLLFTCGKK